MLAATELHCERECLVGLLEAINGGDVRMVERGKQVRLTTKARHAFGILRERGGEYLIGTSRWSLVSVAR